MMLWEREIVAALRAKSPRTALYSAIYYQLEGQLWNPLMEEMFLKMSIEDVSNWVAFDEATR